MEMPTKPRYLTKSRFKTGCECPTKLFYSGKKEYGNTKDDNSFLKSLAEGGFQVGELAKLYYPGGTEVDTLDYNEAIARTTALMAKENVVIYEGAFQFDKYFVRVDVINKVGSNVELIEVKAKSVDVGNLSFFKISFFGF